MKLGGPRSITLRLTLLFAAVSSAVLLALGMVIANLVDRHFAELDLELLNGKLELVQNALAQVRTREDLDALGARLDAALVGQHELSVQVRSANGETLYSTADANFPRQDTLKAGVTSSSLVAGRDGRMLRLLHGQAALGVAGTAPAHVELATSLAHHEAFMVSFHAALWATVALAAIATGLLGWAAARSGLAPMRKISRDAARITAEQLDRRVPAAALPKELAEVALALNQMLARLQASFRRLSDFSSDLAHELRTPLSNLLTQTQVTLAKARSEDEYREVLASNVEEYERLSRTIADMLFLAKADNELIVPHREPLDLRDETEAVAEFYRTVAEEKNISLEVEGCACAAGDRLMLRRAIGNVLSNACRHTHPGGHITVRLGTSHGVSIAIANTGDTIAPSHLPHLFDRFYRADTSRRRDSEGAGLGLAITRSIMRAHGGDATVQSSNGHTVFELRLPE